MTQLNNNPDGLDSVDTPKGISRRTVAKAAAWSVPVLAVAVATPLAAASIPAFDVAVAGHCDLLGIGPSTRGFNVSITGGTLPAGSTFTLTSTGLLPSAGVIPNAGGLVAISVLTANSVLITTSVALPAGSSFHIGLDDALLSVALLATFNLTSNTADSNGGNNTSSVALLVSVGVGNLVNVCV